MKIVVTDGAGFIRRTCARTLLADGAVTEVVATFDDLSTGYAANVDGLDVELVEATILDPDALDARRVRGARSIVHLGARGSVPARWPIRGRHQANASGTTQVLEAARAPETSTWWSPSSSSVYGANTELPKHRIDGRPAGQPVRRPSWPPSPTRWRGSTPTGCTPWRSGSSTCSDPCRPSATPTRSSPRSCRPFEGPSAAGARRRHPVPGLHLRRHRVRRAAPGRRGPCELTGTGQLALSPAPTCWR